MEYIPNIFRAFYLAYRIRAAAEASMKTISEPNFLSAALNTMHQTLATDQRSFWGKKFRRNNVKPL